MHKYQNSFLFLALLALSNTCFAQTVNWQRVSPENQHLIYAGTGLNFGMGISVGYAYRLKTAHSILLNAEFSSPFGGKIFDDFKTKLSVQTPVWQAGNFAAAIKVSGLFRRFESDFVQMDNFGSETGAVFGFYKRKWFVAGEVAFDKAITTHLKHSDIMHESKPGIRDGWYVPTGGNFLYGIQAGISFGKTDLHVSVGKSVTQDFKTTPTLPFYAQIGVNRRF